MTVIVGCLGVPIVRREAFCNDMLQAQSAIASSEPKFAQTNSVTFGVAIAGPISGGEGRLKPERRGPYLAVADIRLSNRTGLCRRINRSRSSCSDIELLCELWEHEGEECLRYLAGDFAIALWDADKRRLTLARDPTGQAPLFYARTGDLIAFSTMARGLLAVPELRRGFNFERIGSALATLNDTAEDSYFAGIKRVPAGCMVRFEGGSCSISRYWRPPQDELSLTDAEFAETYRQYLQDSVSGAMATGRNVGVHLSSGLDSSAVSACAASLASKPLYAFTAAPRLGFDGPVPRTRSADESTLAGLTASMNGLQHVVVRPTAAILDRARQQCRLYDEPICDMANMTWVSAVSAEARSRGLDTLLSAEMGNLSLNAGGLPALSELIRQGHYLEWWKQCAGATRSGEASVKGALYNSFEGRLSPSFRRLLGRIYDGSPGDDEAYFGLLPKKRSPSLRRSCHKYKGRYAQRFRLISSYDVGVFRKGVLSEFGIREIDPTADRRLLDFSFQLPPSQLLHDGVWRPLVRRALAGMIPGEVLNAKTRGYQSADWYERLTKSHAYEVLEEVKSSKQAGQIIDLRKLEAAIDAWPASGWADARVMELYRVRVPIALVFGIFIQEFESLVAAQVTPPD